MKRHLLFLSLLGSGLSLSAQSLTTVTGIRIYEHHSSSMNNGLEFGAGANGSKSAYDFVNRKYVYSFDSATFGAYSGGQEANIDLAEHNGPFGNNGSFGFTSGVSTIWNGDIKGNNSTTWMEAPASFNYATVTNVSQIMTVVGSNTNKAIAAVQSNKVYLGRIRNTNLYVAMRVTNVKNATGMTGIQDVYFDFEYKYAKYVPVAGIGDVEAKAALSISPNPATDHIVLRNTAQQSLSARIVSVTGQEAGTYHIGKSGSCTVDLRGFSKGLYFVICTLKNGGSYTHKLIRN